MENKNVAFKVLLIFGLFCLIGISFLLYGRKRDIPALTTDQILIAYNWPDVNAEVIEARVTAPYESAISTLKGIKKISSNTRLGTASVNVDVDGYTDVHQLRYEISTLLRSLFKKMPSGVSVPVVTTIKGDDMEKQSLRSIQFQLLLTSQDVDRLAGLKLQFNDVFRTRPEVSHVVFPDDLVPELHIRLKDEAMSRYKITPGEVAEVLRKEVYAERTWDSGTDKISQTRQNFVFESDFSLDQLESIPMTSWSGINFFLRDIADISIRKSEQRRFHKINGLEAIDVEVITTNGLLSEAETIIDLSRQLNSRLNKGEFLIIKENGIRHISEHQKNHVWTAVISTLSLMILVYLFSGSLANAISFICCIMCFAISQMLENSLIGCSDSGILLLSLLITESVIAARIIGRENIYSEIIFRPDYRLVADGIVVIIAGGSLLYFKLLSGKYMEFVQFFLVGYAISSISLAYLVPAFNCLFTPSPSRGRFFSYLFKYYRLAAERIKLLAFGRWARILLIVLPVFALGLPFFLIPKTIHVESQYAKIYNSTIGTDLFQSNIKPNLEWAMGGAITYFYKTNRKKVPVKPNSQTSMRIRAQFPFPPYPSTIDQLVGSLEEITMRYKYVSKLEVAMVGPQELALEIWFPPGAKKSSIPIHLRSQLQRFANDNGLVTFQLEGYGLPYDNRIVSPSTGYEITILGYQYSRLKALAQNLEKLLAHNPRVRNIEIGTQKEFSGNTMENTPVLTLSQKKIAQMGKSLNQKDMVNYIRNNNHEPVRVMEAIVNGQEMSVILENKGPIPDKWLFLSRPMAPSGQMNLKIATVAGLHHVPSKTILERVDQQYSLSVSYDFLGDDFLGSLTKDRMIDSLKTTLPLGFSISENAVDVLSQVDIRLWLGIFCSWLTILIALAIFANNLRPALFGILFVSLSFAGPLFLTAYCGSSGLFKDYQLFIVLPLLGIAGGVPDILCCYIGGVIAPKEQGKFFKVQGTYLLGLVPAFFTIQTQDFEYLTILSLIGTLAYSIALFPIMTLMAAKKNV